MDHLLFYCIGLGIVYIHLVGTRIFTETWFRLDFSKVVGSIPRWSSIIITNITFTYIVVFIRFWTCILFTSISHPLLWFCFCQVGLMLTYLAHFFLFVRYIPVSHYWKICIGIINDSCWIDVPTTCTELTDTDIVIPAQHAIPMFIGRARIKVCSKYELNTEIALLCLHIVHTANKLHLKDACQT
jgi:hypothetical protein